MWKRLGFTVVACGVMLGIAGAADAGTLAVKNTNRSTVQRVVVRPHSKTVRHSTHKTIQHRRQAATKTSFQNNLARRGNRHWHRHHHHHNGYRMV